MKIPFLLLIPLLLFPEISREQIQAVLPVGTAKDGSLTAVAYDWEVIGVNPANLGWQVNHKFSFTVLDAGVSAQSEGNNFPAFMNLINSQNLISSSNSSQQILGAPRGMNISADINWFAVSFRIPKIPGAFAINMRDRVWGNGFLGPNTPLAVGNGENQIFSDQATLVFLSSTSVQYTHYREINIDYGLPLFKFGGDGTTDINKCFTFSGQKNVNTDQDGLYAGIGFKYLIGYANINANVDSGINAVYNINSSYPDIPPPKGLFNGPGHGYAFDVGLSAIYKRWKFGLSITDIGSITWKQGYVTFNDTTIYQIRHGSDLWNELINGTLAGSVPASAYTTALPYKLRAGVAFQWTPIVLVSADFIDPLNTSPIGPNALYGAVGAQIKIKRHVAVWTGFATAQGYGWGFPLGFTFTVDKHFQFYLGTSDVTSYIRPRDADVSLAVWMFRYNL